MHIVCSTMMFMISRTFVSLRFVAASMDDNEGNRTLQPINNYHSIVKFEVAWDQSVSNTTPNAGWETITPLRETVETHKHMVDGDRLRVWVRATDVMGNTKVDSTVMKIDGSPPYISDSNSPDHGVELNVRGGKYNHSSRCVN